MILKRTDKLEQALDVLSLCAVFAYIAYKFLANTTFPFTYSNTFRYVFIPLLLCGSARIILYLSLDLRDCIENKNRNAILARHLLAGCIALPFFIVALHIDFLDLMSMPLATACLYRMRAHRVLRIHMLVTGALLSATVLCCLAGCIANISSPEVLGSYGMINTTDYAAYYVFLLLDFWCILRNGRWYEAFLLALLCTVFAVAINTFTGSRTSAICCMLLAVAICVERGQRVFSSRSAIRQLFLKITNWIAICAFPLCAATLGVCCYAYGHGSGWAQKLNLLLSRRLEVTWNVFQEKGVHLLGANFTMHGRGGSMLGSGQSYDYLDSTYAYLLLRFGLLVFAIVMAFWVWTTFRAVKTGNMRVAYTMAIIAFYGFSEAQMLNANYNAFIIMPFCIFPEINNRKYAKQNNESASRNWWLALGTSVGYILIFWELAPRILSWLRTYFYLEHWNSGWSTAYALLFCLCFMSCLYLIWKLPLCIAREKNGVVVAALSFSIGVILVGIFILNNRIVSALHDSETLLEIEQPVIEAVMESATNPVYSAEKSELYNRRFYGFSDHAATVDSIAKDRKGTMFVDSSNEDIRLQLAGAQYVQFSDTSGIYSFDHAVVARLQSAGYSWSTFYNSLHSADLYDLSQTNGLEISESGRLVLDGQKHSLLSTRPMDQLAGTYEVALTLMLEPGCNASSYKNTACIFKVGTNKGEVTIFEQQITLDQFDTEHICKARFTYNNLDMRMPRVVYTLEVPKGVRLYLDELTWRRLA